MRISVLIWLGLAASATAQPRYFRIEVVERDAGTPIAGVKLETTGRIVLTTDVNGMVAFYEPGLMSQRVHFVVTRSGYEHPEDGFRYRGKAFDILEGGTGRIELVRSGFDAGRVPVVGDEHSRRLLDGGVPTRAQLFALRVVDARTDAGVPLVFVEAGDAQLITDSSGLVAWENTHSAAVTLAVHSHGYRPRTAVVTPIAGTQAQIAIERLNIAERIYRVTGGGIYRDAVLLGLATPLAQPVLSGKVTGQDSVLSTLYHAEPFFVWGDTNRPAYPLGNFASSAARSSGVDAAKGVDLHYFVDAEGFSKKMAPMAEPGLVWLNGLVNVAAEDGGEALFANYGIYPSLTAPTQVGIVRFNDSTERFVKVLQIDAGTVPDGHALKWGDSFIYSNGVKIPARADAMTAPQTWQILPRLDLDGGRAIDAENGETISLHDNDTIDWNPHRGRFIRLASQTFGKSSFLGELYYLEADTARGPWIYARKVVSHDDYTFYNPRHHRFFDESNGRRIYFEGTYTKLFSRNAVATPRYDYNQMMYRLDLDDPALVMPVVLYAVPAVAGELLVTRDSLSPTAAVAAQPMMMALDRSRPGAVAVYRRSVCNGSYQRTANSGTPSFWGTDTIEPGTTALDLGDGSQVRVWSLPRRDFIVEPWLAPEGISAPEVCSANVSSIKITATTWGLTEPVQYRWTTPLGFSDGPEISPALPVGLHPLSVTATDRNGRVVQTKTWVEVGNAAPRACECSTGGASVALALVLLLWGWRRQPNE